jgi:hypothetical protein
MLVIAVILAAGSAPEQRCMAMATQSVCQNLFIGRINVQYRDALR